jgi:hypothetical protein
MVVGEIHLLSDPHVSKRGRLTRCDESIGCRSFEQVGTSEGLLPIGGHGDSERVLQQEQKESHSFVICLIPKRWKHALHMDQ